MGPSFVSSLGKPEYFSLWFSAGIALLIALALRLRNQRVAPWIIAAAAFVPVPIVALCSTQQNLVGWHGFMQASPVYQIMERGQLPPEDPLFAGGSLRYPWVEQALVAYACRFTGLNVHVLTICVEIAAFGALLAATAWLASTITRDRVTIALAAFFSAYGLSMVHNSILGDAVMRAFPPLWLENRCVPVDKFANITAMPVGYAALALSMGAGVRLASGIGRARTMALIIAASTLAAALFHPLSWLCLLAFQGATGLVLLASLNRRDLIRAAMLAGAVLVPTALCWPYLRNVGATESSGGSMGLTFNAELFLAKAVDLAIFLAPFVLLAYLHRHALGERLRRGDRALTTFFTAIVISAVAYLAFSAPARNEYKFLHAMTPPAAAILALCFLELFRRHLVLATISLALMLLPGARALGYRPWFNVSDHCRTDGPYLRALDPQVDDLYQYIATNTPPDAVFLAPDLRVPPLGHRSLYIAVHATWQGRDGWGVMRNDLLQQHIRRPDAVMYQRQALATVVLNPDWARPAAEVIAAIRADIPGRTLFVDAADVERRGAVLTWQSHEPGLPENLKRAFPRAELQPPVSLPQATLLPWVTRSPIVVYFAIVLPRP